MTYFPLRRMALACALLVTVLPGCDGSASEQVVSPAEVQQAFRMHGLPLRESTLGRLDSRLFESPRAGQVFRVEFYETIAAARKAETAPSFVILTITNTSEGRRMVPRGEVQEVRRANVLVFYDDGRPVVRRRLQAALAALGTS